MTNPLKRILLVDDSPRDTELALDALAQNSLAKEVVTLRDGVEALDYLYRRGPFVDRTDSQPAVVLLDLKMPKVDGIEALPLPGPRAVPARSPQERGGVLGKSLSSGAVEPEPVAADGSRRTSREAERLAPTAVGGYGSLSQPPPVQTR